VQTNDVPDYEKGHLRYGAPLSTATGSARARPQHHPQPMPQERRLVTDMAWGYRVRARLDYGRRRWAAAHSPSMVWNHDDRRRFPWTASSSKTARRFGMGLASTYAKRGIHGGHDYTVVRPTRLTTR